FSGLGAESSRARRQGDREGRVLARVRGGGVHADRAGEVEVEAAVGRPDPRRNVPAGAAVVLTREVEGGRVAAGVRRVDVDAGATEDERVDPKRERVRVRDGRVDL